MVNLDVLLTDDLVLPLRLVDRLVVLFGLAFQELQSVEESVLLFFLVPFFLCLIFLFQSFLSLFYLVPAFVLLPAFPCKE